MFRHPGSQGLGFPLPSLVVKGLPWWLSGEESAFNAGDREDVGSIPGSRRNPGGGHGNRLQDSCLENAMDRGAWLATFHGIAELDTTEQLTLSCHPNKSNPITALTGGSSGVGLCWTVQRLWEAGQHEDRAPPRRLPRWGPG